MSRGLSERRGLAPSTIKYSLHILWSENSQPLNSRWPRATWEADLELANKEPALCKGRPRQQTHPLLLMPVHLQGRPAAPPCPPGHQGVLVIPKHHLLLLSRGGGGLGCNVVGPCCIQPMDGVGQQLTVTDSHQLPSLQVHTNQG